MTLVEWTYTVETSRFLHSLTLTAVGAVGGLFVLVGALGAVVLGGSLLAGELAVLAVAAGLAVLFARRLALNVALAGREPGLREYFSARELLGASAAWAAAYGAALWLDAGTTVVRVCVFGAALVCLPLGAALRSEGRVDTDEGVFEANGTEVPLAAVDAVSRYDVGPVTVLRVRYHEGAGGTRAPRLLGVPRADAGRVRAALEASEAAPPDRDRHPLVAKTLYAFGAAAFALAAGLAYYGVRAGGDAAVVGVYAAAFAALFGAIFAWLGYVER
ncbi:hypothetical protein [Halobacterium yunchengense]|uniref:hypothetical protein n=1 Tax=Halobacterium yunchengense TaxID=3108497 RepID=UPI00300B5122